MRKTALSIVTVVLLAGAGLCLYALRVPDSAPARLLARSRFVSRWLNAEPGFTEEVTYVVLEKGAAVHSGPGSDFPVVASVAERGKFRVVLAREGWCKISHGELRGWVNLRPVVVIPGERRPLPSAEGAPGNGETRERQEAAPRGSESAIVEAPPEGSGQPPPQPAPAAPSGKALYTLEDLELLARAERLTDDEVHQAISKIVCGMMKQQTEAAREFMDPRSVRETTVNGYRILTDLAGRAELEGLVQGYGAARRFFARVFPEFAEPRAWTVKRPTFVVFARLEGYQAYCRRGFGPERPDPMGHYTAETRTVTLTAEPFTHNEPLRALIHEAGHDLLRTRIIPAGKRIPRWVDEGVATLLEGIVPWQAPGRKARLFPPLSEDGAAARGALNPDGEGRVLSAAADLAAGTFPKLEALTGEASWEDLSEAERTRLYNASFCLVHYLRFGPGKRERAAFIAYLKNLARGAYTPFPEGLDEDAVGRGLHLYIVRLHGGGL